MKPCPRCKGEEFAHIPDSLAHACAGCGFVWVGGSDDSLTPGATIGRWLKDVYGVPNTLDKPWEEEGGRGGESRPPPT